MRKSLLVLYLSLSCTVSEVSVKYGMHDVEIWVRGCSKSLKVVPFERLVIVSYSHSRVL